MTRYYLRFTISDTYILAAILGTLILVGPMRAIVNMHKYGFVLSRPMSFL